MKITVVFQAKVSVIAPADGEAIEQQVGAGEGRRDRHRR